MDFNTGTRYDQFFVKQNERKPYYPAWPPATWRSRSKFSPFMLIIIRFEKCCGSVNTTKNSDSWLETIA